MTLGIRPLDDDDPRRIAAAFETLGWAIPTRLHEGYLAEQAAGARAVLVAEVGGDFAGYVTIVWDST